MSEQKPASLLAYRLKKAMDKLNPENTEKENSSDKRKQKEKQERSAANARIIASHGLRKGGTNSGGTGGAPAAH